MKIDKFEEILAWKEARILTRRIYENTNQPTFVKDIGLRRQVQNAAISVMANIAEGFDRQSRKEFIQFLNYASASASEVQSHLYVALDQEYISEEIFR